MSDLYDDEIVEAAGVAVHDEMCKSQVCDHADADACIIRYQRIARSVLDGAAPLIAGRALREAAAKARANWAPQPCPWVGFLDDEADRVDPPAWTPQTGAWGTSDEARS